MASARRACAPAALAAAVAFITTPVLVFRNLGEEAKLASVEGYDYAWMRYDNATGKTEPLPDGQGRTSARRIAVPSVEHPVLLLRLRTLSAAEPAWGKSVDVVLRHEGDWTVIGVDRER